MSLTNEKQEIEAAESEPLATAAAQTDETVDAGLHSTTNRIHR